MNEAQAVKAQDDWPEEFQQFFNWWHSLEQHGQLVPAASDFDSLLPEALRPMSVLMKREKGGDFYICEIGAALNATSVEDLRGSKYLSLFPKDEAEALGSILVSICGHPCGGDSLRKVRTSAGDQILVRDLILPMCGVGGIIRYACAHIQILDKYHIDGEGSRSTHFEAIQYIDIGEGTP